jgi:methylated-DNA-[protein]-cysteine S-methyltransferase
MKKVGIYQSPIGPLWLEEENNCLVGLYFEDPIESIVESPLLTMVKMQLDEYFCGKRHTFTIPLTYQGTPFQMKVWNTLRSIPYGTTCSYQELANQIASPRAARAVGMANNRNPLPIVIPCHRVIGKNGALVGYAGGLPRKQFLLNLEQSSHQ